jgi:hypothetical protein
MFVDDTLYIVNDRYAPGSSDTQFEYFAIQRFSMQRGDLFSEGEGILDLSRLPLSGPRSPNNVDCNDVSGFDNLLRKVIQSGRLEQIWTPHTQPDAGWQSSLASRERSAQGLDRAKSLARISFASENRLDGGLHERGHFRFGLIERNLEDWSRRCWRAPARDVADLMVGHDRLTRTYACGGGISSRSSSARELRGLHSTGSATRTSLLGSPRGLHPRCSPSASNTSRFE